MNELITPLYDKKVTCLYCETSYTTKKLRSRFVKIKSTDSDFCPYYVNKEHSPLLYFISVCPSCGFSANEQFSSYFPPMTKEAIQENIVDKWTPQNFSNERTYEQAVQTYKLALISAQYKKERAIVQAGILLRLMWLYRTMEKKEEEMRFLQLARNTLELAYQEGNYSNTEMTELRVLYLIGELYRRTGHYKEAIYNFSKVLEQQNSTVEFKMISLAREQWQATREEQKKKRELENAAKESQTK